MYPSDVFRFDAKMKNENLQILIKGWPATQNYGQGAAQQIHQNRAQIGPKLVPDRAPDGPKSTPGDPKAPRSAPGFQN